MIGQDCKQFEENIDKFIQVFLKYSENIEARSFEKIRNVSTLYRLFRDLAVDIRSSICDISRIETFNDRAENLFATLKKHSAGRSTGRKPYLHILREHCRFYVILWQFLVGDMEILIVTLEKI